MSDFVIEQIKLILKLETLLLEAEEDYRKKKKYNEIDKLDNINKLIKKISNKIDSLWYEILDYLKVKEIPQDLYNYFIKEKVNIKPNYNNHNYKESYNLLTMRKKNQKSNSNKKTVYCAY